MISVFAAFLLTPDVEVKMFAVGLTVAVLVDATIVRMILVPATMALMGDANWWLPGWLDRILPHVDVEGSSVLGHLDDVPAITVPDDLSELDDDREVVHVMTRPARRGLRDGPPHGAEPRAARDARCLPPGHRASPRPDRGCPPPATWWGSPHHRTPGSPISAIGLDSYRRTHGTQPR